ncbi:MAG TPA: gamma-glutamylcyclotransferase family protein [Solirubrobacteraceae bacterium]
MWVFGYGSLAALPGAEPATLAGHRRTWGVAMDNRVEIPGYKVYEDAGGNRPAVCVAFLDVEPDEHASVSGARIEVDDGALADLDARERSYERVEVQPGVFVYRGRAERRAIAAAARRDGRLVVQRDYLELVRAALGAVEEPDCPVVDLIMRPT